MTIQNALHFLNQIHKDHLLKELIKKNIDSLDLEEVVRIGAQYGYEFKVEDLRDAFIKDWSLRRHYYSHK